MKLLDIFLVNDQSWMIVKSIFFMLFLVLSAFSIIFYLKTRKSYDFSKTVVVLTALAAISFLFVVFNVNQGATLESQISKVSEISLISGQINFKIDDGEDVLYKFDRSTSKYSSTNNLFIERLNEIMGRYDFTYIKSIKQIGEDQWKVTFKCDCGKVKSEVIGK